MNHLVPRAAAAANARNATAVGKSKSEAKVDPDPYPSKYNHSQFKSSLGVSPEFVYCTVKTRTSAHLAPCGGTATKYSFNAGTKRPVLPSGPVGTFPMA